MPIYEFACMECETHFEELVRSADSVSCPDCGASNVRKQLSKFAAMVGSAAQASSGGGGSSGGCCGGGCGCSH